MRARYYVYRLVGYGPVKAFVLALSPWVWALLGILILLFGLSGCAPNPTAPATSTENTVAYPGQGHIIDANLHDWYLSLASDIYEDGRLVLSPNLGGVVFTGRAQRLVWQSPHVLAYGEDDNQWWMYDGTRFVPWVQP